GIPRAGGRGCLAPRGGECSIMVSRVTAARPSSTIAPREAGLQQFRRLRRKPLSRALIRDALAEFAGDNQRRPPVHRRPLRDGELFGITALYLTGALPVGDSADEQTERAVACRLECGVGALVSNLRPEHHAEVRRMLEREPDVGDAQLLEPPVWVSYPL